MCMCMCVASFLLPSKIIKKRVFETVGLVQLLLKVVASPATGLSGGPLDTT